MDLTRPKTFPPIPSSHADEDTIELYALGRLAAPEAAHLETHLLICSRCQAALTEAAEFAGAMKSALAARAKDAVEFGPEAAGSARSVNPIAAMARRMGKLLQMPSVAPAAIAGLLAAVALVAVNVRNPEANRTPAEVELRSLRGGAAESDANTVDYDSNTVEYRSNRAEAPAHAPLHIVIQSSHLTVPVGGHIEIVDQAGSTAWAGPMEANREDAHPSATVDKPLGPGDYWVRLYGGTALLQEYGLRLR